jgi:hypothetical protein
MRKLASRAACRRAGLALALAATGGASLALASADAAAPDRVTQALLNMPLENVPSSQRVAIAPIAVSADDKAKGLAGAVRITFPGGDPKAAIAYYVFDSSGDAIAYDNQHLSLPIGTGKLLAYPPLAQCDTLAAGGYCDMVVQDDAVAIVATTTAGVDDATATLIGLAFQHLAAIEEAAFQPPPAVVVGELSACALVDVGDVTGALGAPASQPRPDQIGGCSWSAGAGTVSIQPKDGGRAQFDSDRTRLTGTTTLTGVGDAAFAFQSLAGFVQINILKGGRYVVLTVQPQTGANAMPAASRLAASIVSRM